MKPATDGMSIVMTALVVLAALMVELFLLGPLFEMLFLQVDGLSFWTALAMLCLPKGVIYGLMAYLGVRFLGRYGHTPSWAYVALLGACWFGLRWGRNWPGPGWIGMLATYAPLLIVPPGLIVGAAIGQWVTSRANEAGR